MKAKAASTEALARELGVSTRTVREYRAAGMPSTIAGSRTWRRKRAEQRAAARGADPEYRRWRAERERIKAGLAQLDLMVRTGQLVSRPELEETFLERIFAAKQVLEAIPRKLAARLVGMQPREIEGAIDEEVRAALTQLSRPVTGGKRLRRGRGRPSSEPQDYRALHASEVSPADSQPVAEPAAPEAPLP